jgi:hypothetical protein
MKSFGRISSVHLLLSLIRQATTPIWGFLVVSKTNNVLRAILSESLDCPLGVFVQMARDFLLLAHTAVAWSSSPR